MTESLDLDPDDLAGVVDLFGTLTRDELDRALEELAYKQGAEPPGPAVVELALQRYVLVAYDPEGDVDSPLDDDPDRLLVPGPSAFPSLPEGAADLPHIMDVPTRIADREAVERAAEARFRGDVARAVADEDEQLVRRLLDVSYDLDAWGLEMADLRGRLDAVLD
ncbi:hypothetical protein ACFQML_01110 [Salinirubellus salinus]|uniref:DUF7109 family protein n=1 Tax=Salinirubellus salinus TaxID=1364945 RepID=UPI0034A57D85